MNKKVAFIIPGFCENSKLLRYKQIAEFFKQNEISPVIVNIDWKYNVPSDYVAQFIDIFNNHQGQKNYLFGFSYGALIAFAAATKLNLNGIILCSLSPSFLEDYEHYSDAWKRLDGKKRMSDMIHFKFENMVRKISCKVFILYGDKELDLLIKRSQTLHNTIRNSNLFVVNGAGHHLSKVYLEEVKRVVLSLN